MSQKYEKLKTLLKELLPQVQTAFNQYKTADKTVIEQDLAKAIEQAQSLGVEPESVQKVKDLRARLANEAVDLGTVKLLFPPQIGKERALAL